MAGRGLNQCRTLSLILESIGYIQLGLTAQLEKRRGFVNRRDPVFRACLDAVQAADALEAKTTVVAELLKKRHAKRLQGETIPKPANDDPQVILNDEILLSTAVDMDEVAAEWAEAGEDPDAADSPESEHFPETLEVKSEPQRGQCPRRPSVATPDYGADRLS